MTQETRIFKILNDIRPECDFQSSENFIADGLLDSFDLVMLVPSLEETFSISIPGDQIVAEHFVSANTIAELVNQCTK